jgi:DNA polymerase-3 subunit epsilon
MTAKLWLAMLHDVRERYVLSAIDFRLMQKLAKTPKHAVSSFWEAACHTHKVD